MAGNRPSLGAGPEAADLRSHRGHRGRPTCSLPEEVGGTRNWDYRYTWIRDAAFTLYALLRIGFTEEAAAFMGLARPAATTSTRRRPPGHVRHPRRPASDEEQLDHLDGYRDASRYGSATAPPTSSSWTSTASSWMRVYLYNKYASPIPYDLWMELRRLMDWVCDNWQTPGRRHLGDPRRASAFGLLEAHVLGRHRPGPPPGRQAILPR